MGEDKRGRDLIKPYVPVLAAIIITFGATFSANYLLVRDIAPEIIAPDRFTGAEGRLLEHRLAKLETKVAQLRREIDRLPPRELTERILKLELDLEQIKRDVGRQHSE